MMKSAGGYLIIPDHKLNVEMRNLTYPGYFNVERYYETKFTIPLVEQNYSVTPPKVES